mmetsp:Transcript_85627/g.247145  ORF Transcript_85627/g.247145 Transcript_85627/m.247145 type:complete len:220 (-) Transcript_85627:1251-1910(-)
MLIVASVPETYCTESSAESCLPIESETWGWAMSPANSDCSGGGGRLHSSWILNAEFFTGGISLATRAKGNLNSVTTVRGSLLAEKYDVQARTSKLEQSTVVQTRKVMGTTSGLPPGVIFSRCTDVCDRAKQLGALKAMVMFSTGLPPSTRTKRFTVHCITTPSTRPTGSSASVSSSWFESSTGGTWASTCKFSSASLVPSPCVCRMMRSNSWCSSSISS